MGTNLRSSRRRGLTVLAASTAGLLLPKGPIRSSVGGPQDSLVSKPLPGPITLQGLQELWETSSVRKSSLRSNPAILAVHLTLETRPFTELKLDGIDQVELLIEIEDTFGVEIPDSVTEPLRHIDPTILQILDALNSHLTPQTA